MKKTACTSMRKVDNGKDEAISLDCADWRSSASKSAVLVELDDMTSQLAVAHMK